jgi:hypothetical protein
LIEEKVQEEKVFRAKKSVMEANREKRNKSNVNTSEEKKDEIPLYKREPGYFCFEIHIHGIAV